MKSPADVDKEGAILSEMLEIVEKKDSLRSMLEEDRQRRALFLNLVDWAQGSLDNSEDDYDDGGGSASEGGYNDVFFANSGSLSLESEPEVHEEYSEITNNEAVKENNKIDCEFVKGEEEFEQIFGSSKYSDERYIAGRDDSEFDRLVQELSEDSSTNSWNPTVEVDGFSVQLKDLVSAHELQMWTESAALVAVAQEEEDDDPAVELRRRPQRSASLTVNSFSSEEFYQRRLPKPTVTQNDPIIAINEVRVITAVEADDDVKFEGSTEKDWGSLGVRFENRGVVRDLVWQWEYNHLQQSGRLGAVPDDNVGALRPVKRRSSRMSNNRLAPPTDHLLHSASSSDFESVGQPNKKKKKTRKRVAQPQSQESSSKPMDDTDDNQWPLWQIGLLLWLAVFSIFVIYNLFFVSSWHPFFFF